MNIVEFAKLANLSTATISRAFHEPEKIRSSTRERVLTLADQMGYYPSASARALVKGRHDVLGVVWPLEVEGAGALFAHRFLGAFTQQLVRNDLDLLICPVDRSQLPTVDHARRTILRGRCDAWILLYPRHNDMLIKALNYGQKPVICVMGELKECPTWRFVTLDQNSWIEKALEMLRAKGSQRVLFLGCRKEEPDHIERLAAFSKLAPTYFGSHFVTMPDWPLDVDKVKEMLSTGEIDAVIGVDDAAALAAAKACQQARLAIPERIQIIGIDDSADAAAAAPPLTTFRQPLDEMAACAVDLALGHRVRSGKFKATLVAGGSVR
jgi:DNA-binding LacI/PurR family transcriptional regulator